MQNFFCQEGNLGKDPELIDVMSDSQDKTKVIKKLKLSVRFPINRLAANGEYEDSKGFWCAVEMWGRQAEKLNSLLIKGSRVLVVGSMEDNSFVATKGEREGQLISGMLVNAQFIGLSPLGIETVFYSSQKPQEGISDDGSKGVSYQASNENEHADSDEEIPFES